MSQYEPSAAHRHVLFSYHPQRVGNVYVVSIPDMMPKVLVRGKRRINALAELSGATVSEREVSSHETSVIG